MTSDVEVEFASPADLSRGSPAIRGSDPRAIKLNARQDRLTEWANRQFGDRVVRVLPAVGAALVRKPQASRLFAVAVAGFQEPRLRIPSYGRRPLRMSGVAPAGEADDPGRGASVLGAPFPVIGILDTGVAPHSEFLPGQVVSAHFDEDGTLLDHDHSDFSGHGTAVAAIAAGRGIGVAPGARVASARVFDDHTTSVTAAIAGLDWLVSEAVIAGTARPGCDVVNWSVGMDGRSEALERAIVELLTAFGVLVVAAVGNDGLQGDVDVPAALRDVFAVGGHDNAGSMVGSDWSVVPPKPDVCALGQGVRSADLLQPNDFSEFDGTSFAAPQVTGTFARFLRAGAANAGRPDTWTRLLPGFCEALVPAADRRSRLGRIKVASLP